MSTALLGLMTADRWKHLFNEGQYVRVLLDGQNVTVYCESADDRAGWAVLEIPLERRQKGGPKTELVTGQVTFDVVALRRDEPRTLFAPPPVEGRS